MRFLPALVAVLLTAGAVAGPAQAEQGTGLYAPFPSPSAGPRAQRFVGELGLTIKVAQLDRGRDVARDVATRSAAASARAGRGIDPPSGAQIVLIAVAALVAVLAVVGVGHRRKEFVADTTN